MVIPKCIGQRHSIYIVMNVQILNIRLIHTIIIMYTEISSIDMRKYACRCPLVYNDIIESRVLIVELTQDDFEAPADVVHSI